MRHLWTVLFFLPSVARAADPAPAAAYVVGPTNGAYNSQSVPGYLPMFIDPTNLTIPTGTPTPVSPSKPFPVSAPIPTASSYPTISASPYTITTSASTAIPASATRLRIGYQAQGTGYACVSWVTSSITISGNTAAATCGGNGAFLIGPGSTFNSQYPLTPSGALSVIGASGSALVLAWDAQ